MGNQTMTNLDAQFSTVVIRPAQTDAQIGVPLKQLQYAAAAIIEADVTTADVDGGTDNRVLLFGTLLDA